MIDWEKCSDAEVAALARALHEARFPEVSDDPLVWQSPIVIDLHVAALAEQRRRSAARRLPGARSDEDFLLWRNRGEHAVVVRNLAENPKLAQLCRDDGGETLRNLLRPFVLEPSDIEDLLEQVEALQNASP